MVDVLVREQFPTEMLCHNHSMLFEALPVDVKPAVPFIRYGSATVWGACFFNSTNVPPFNEPVVMHLAISAGRVNFTAAGKTTPPPYLLGRGARGAGTSRVPVSSHPTKMHLAITIAKVYLITIFYRASSHARVYIEPRSLSNSGQFGQEIVRSVAQ